MGVNNVLRLMVFCGFISTTSLAAQQPRPPESAPIQDNSFLIEEAYNQERGVVQHISTFVHSTKGSDWTYAFTQEWPFRSQTHQLSYTIPVGRSDDGSTRGAGLGDIALNYRYQIGGGEARFAIAPRASVLLPTGASRRALGSGGTGFQVNLPFSIELPARLVAHTNAGATYTPRARDTFGNSAATRSYAMGQSAIWLVHPKLNLMLESIWTTAWEVTGPEQTERSTELLLSPGVRGAIDFASGLQVVPGIAFPFGIGNSRGERAVFMYLSFEHPFGRRSQ
ncbi:MAG TPA: hypothetical protein VK571_02225 [Gemmatimonadaceae bacterium]|nr:hypothetical protein [Gemmatimonadaceae bacterium]